jgi:hypothetical protein
MSNTVKIERIRVSEEQIDTHRQAINYDTRAYPIEIIVQNFSEKDEEGCSKIYVPEYHQQMNWDVKRQSQFIESILLGLPLPSILVAEIENTERLEIVDGVERVRTLAAFMTNQLRLENLLVLDSLNNFCFEDLAPSRQRHFKNTPILTIVLSEKGDERVRKEIYNRLNKSSPL